MQLPEVELQRYTNTDLDLASVNGPICACSPDACEDLEALEQRLTNDGVGFSRVMIDVAAHSRMLDPFLDEFEAGLRRIRFSTPKIPFVSNVTGTWISDDEATDPSLLAAPTPQYCALRTRTRRAARRVRRPC